MLTGQVTRYKKTHVLVQDNKYKQHTYSNWQGIVTSILSVDTLTTGIKNFDYRNVALIA